MIVLFLINIIVVGVSLSFQLLTGEGSPLNWLQGAEGRKALRGLAAPHENARDVESEREIANELYIALSSNEETTSP